MGQRADTLIGQVLDGRYEITHRLGCGGMGIVYAAVQRSMGREVAIKVIHPELGTDSDTARRFTREVWWVSRVVCPEVVSVFDFGQTDDGLLYMVMEMVEGKTVAALLRHGGPVETNTAVRIAMHICRALEAAHSRGVIHRDLKPANIMVDESDELSVKVLDFGLAKSMEDSPLNDVTGNGMLVGTRSYMAPELIRGNKPAPTSDLYALGAVLYTMLAGRQPFVGEVMEIMRGHVMEAPPELGDHVPAPIKRVVARLLAKNPRDRYATAADTREALAVALTETTIPPAPASSSVDIEVEIEEVEPSTMVLWRPEALRAPAKTSRPKSRWRHVFVSAAITVFVAAVVFALATYWGETLPPAANAATWKGL